MESTTFELRLPGSNARVLLRQNALFSIGRSQMFLFPPPPLSKPFQSCPRVLPHISKLDRVPSFLSSFELSHFAQIKQLKDLPSSIQEVMQAVRCPIIPNSPGNNCRITWYLFNRSNWNEHWKSQCIKTLQIFPWMFRGKFNDEMGL